jgi:hypothetical protein
VSGLVADDGAVALEGADGEDFVDHSIIVASAGASSRELRNRAANKAFKRPSGTRVQSLPFTRQ